MQPVFSQRFGPEQSSFQEVNVRGTRKTKAMLTALALAVGVTGVVGTRTALTSAQSAPSGAPLVVYGDITLFAGLGKPDNCMLKSRYKRGEPVGFRMTAIDPQTGKREESAELVVHLNYAGSTVDVPMRYRGTAKQPELEFWVAKWMVPDNAPTGIIRYSVTAKDKKGRTGEFKPFRQDLSELTVVE
jgi:hypothetical protein